MKRIFLMGLTVFILIFILPLFGREQKKTGDTDGKDVQQILEELQTSPESVTDELLSGTSTQKSTGLDEQTKVTVLIDGTVRELTLAEYLPCVLTAEMPAEFPEEALKAQAVAARTYAVYKKRLIELGQSPPESHQGAELCADYHHCKAYVDVWQDAEKLWGSKSDTYRDKIVQAVRDTNGLILVYENEPIAAVFHAASAEKTENAVDVWGAETPYLESVESPGGDASPRYYASVEVTKEEFVQKFKAKYPQADLSTPINTWFRASKRSEAGGVITVAVGGIRVKGTEIREMFGLNSTNFKLKFTENTITFQTTGYGHGVGMSQYGARALALEGKKYDEILAWYYKNTELKKRE